MILKPLKSITKQHIYPKTIQEAFTEVVQKQGTRNPLESDFGAPYGGPDFLTRQSDLTFFRIAYVSLLYLRIH